MGIVFRIAAAGLCAGSLASPAFAQAPFAGKQITLTVSSEPGNGYDTYARAVAHVWPKHIPGQPPMVVKNMQGASGLLLANYLYNQAGKDGTELGACQSGTVLEKVFHTVSEGGKNAMFDATKFGWIGTANQSTYLLVARSDAVVKTFDDLQRHELIVGASSANSDNGLNANLLKRMFNAKIKVIYGYPGPALDLAIDRGELQGAAGKDYSSVKSVRPYWLSEKKVNLLVQFGIKPHPELKHVPLVLDLAKTPEEHQVLELIFVKYSMSRPYLAPPGLAPERLATLRAAFDAAVADPEFLALAAKQRLEINPLGGKEVEAMVSKIFSMPEPLLARARAAVQPGN